MQLRIDSRRYGLNSGFATALGLSPHVLFLSLLWLTGKSTSLGFLITASIGAKLLGEYFFWRVWTDDIKEFSNGANWKLNYAMLQHPNVQVSIGMIAIDCIADGTLILFALNASFSPLVAFLILLGCQGLISPIQGLYSDLRSQKNSLLFACITTLGCLIATQQVPPIWLGFLLGLKGILGNMTTIARAAIAEAFIHQFKNRESTSSY